MPDLTRERQNMPTRRVFQETVVARDETVSKRASRGQKNPIGGISRRGARKKGRCDEYVGRHVRKPRPWGLEQSLKPSFGWQRRRQRPSGHQHPDFPCGYGRDVNALALGLQSQEAFGGVRRASHCRKLFTPPAGRANSWTTTTQRSPQTTMRGAASVPRRLPAGWSLSRRMQAPRFAQSWISAAAPDVLLFLSPRDSQLR